MADSAYRVRDTDWVRRSFLLPKRAMSMANARRELFYDVSQKFTDTTLGGNFAINPPPQFTPTADLPVLGRFSGSTGMGRYYSEALDDTSHVIHMSFGVPSFNSLTTFFNNFYNAEAGSLARTGRGRGLFYMLGRGAGFVLTVPLLPIIYAGRAFRFFSGTPSSKYYSLKPAMPLYWNAVNNILNGIAVNMGIVPRLFSEDSGDRPGYSSSDLEHYHKLMPEIYRKDGGIDIYSVATRAQRLADKHHKRILAEMEAASSPEDLRNRMRAMLNENITDDGPVAFSGPGGETGIAGYLRAWERNEASASSEKAGEVTEESSDKWYNKLWDQVLAELRDGSRFVSFRVNAADSVSESFTNHTRETDLAATINSMSSSGRSRRFTFAGGNIGDGVIASAIEGIIGAASDVVTGLADQLGVSGLAALSGAAFVDIPKMWDSASTSFPTMSYTLQLRSPYGNKMSRFMNLYVPLAMLLAGALPLSTGKHSYTSPFLVEVYSRGRGVVRLGIIDSLHITRGVGNLGWTAEGEPLGIDVSFSIMDLSSVMHMPISSMGSIFSEDTAFNDYLATLGNLSLPDMIYPTRKLFLNMTRKLTDLRSWASPTHAVNWATGTLPGRVISGLARVSARE